MYKVKLTEEERDRISQGNAQILLKKLEESDRNVIKELKADKHDRVAYLQGVSYVIDELIKVLKRNA